MCCVNVHQDNKLVSGWTKLNKRLQGAKIVIWIVFLEYSTYVVSAFVDHDILIISYLVNNL